MSFHDELCDGVANLARKSLMPTHVSNKPLIHPGCAVQILRGPLYRYHPPNNISGAEVYFKQKGKLLIRYMW